MYTQKSITEIDNSEGPDVQHSPHSSMAKKKERESDIPPHKYMCLSQEAVCDNTHKTANQVYCTAALTRWEEKQRKAVPTLLSPPSLTWDAITSLEPGQA